MKIAVIILSLCSTKLCTSASLEPLLDIDYRFVREVEEPQNGTDAPASNMTILEEIYTIMKNKYQKDNETKSPKEKRLAATERDTTDRKNYEDDTPSGTRSYADNRSSEIREERYLVLPSMINPNSTLPNSAREGDNSKKSKREIPIIEDVQNDMDDVMWMMSAFRNSMSHSLNKRQANSSDAIDSNIDLKLVKEIYGIFQNKTNMTPVKLGDEKTDDKVLKEKEEVNNPEDRRKKRQTYRSADPKSEEEGTKKRQADKEETHEKNKRLDFNVDISEYEINTEEEETQRIKRDDNEAKTLEAVNESRRRKREKTKISHTKSKLSEKKMGESINARGKRMKEDQANNKRQTREIKDEDYCALDEYQHKKKEEEKKVKPFKLYPD